MTAPTTHLNSQLESQAASLFKIENLTKHFGGVAAVNGVSFDIFPGDIVGLIGPNGSGKTTLFNCVTGLLESEPGSRIVFHGHDITNKPQHHIAKLGLTRTFQDVRIFHQMSVLDNLLIATQQYQEDNLLSRFLNGRLIAVYEQEAHQRAIDLLEFVGLSHHRLTPAEELSHRQRKLLIFAMAMTPKPHLVLLDEPAAAVNPTAIDQLKEYIEELNRQGTTFLVIEHNMEVIMDICHRIVVLDNGEKIAEGTPREVQSNDEVIDAYFGTA